jgi:hypothetical protein
MQLGLEKNHSQSSVAGLQSSAKQEVSVG